MKRILVIAMLAGALAACSGGGAANNAVTPEESAGLNNTAEMLDASPDSLVANNEAPLGNGEEPTPAPANQAAPANSSSSY
jgi:hypothetical protein